MGSKFPTPPPGLKSGRPPLPPAPPMPHESAEDYHRRTGRRPQGPNIKKLIIEKMSASAIPAGGGLAAGIAFLSSVANIIAAAREATAWVEQAIAVFKTAPDNPFGDDDEAIAGEILAGIEARRKAGTL